MDRCNTGEDAGRCEGCRGADGIPFAYAKLASLKSNHYMIVVSYCIISPLEIYRYTLNRDMASDAGSPMATKRTGAANPMPDNECRSRPKRVLGEPIEGEPWALALASSSNPARGLIRPKCTSGLLEWAYHLDEMVAEICRCEWMSKRTGQAVLYIQLLRRVPRVYGSRGIGSNRIIIWPDLVRSSSWRSQCALHDQVGIAVTV